MGGSIVCAIDESGTGRSAASHAIRLARRLRRGAVLVPIGASPDPVTALIDVARREAADLIVVPAASRSIVEALERDAPCPVVVVRARQLTAAA